MNQAGHPSPMLDRLCQNAAPLDFPKLLKRYESCRRRPFVIAVTGGSSTCKSTIVVPAVLRMLSPAHCEVISQDYFQKGRDFLGLPDERFGYDTPEYFGVADSYDVLSSLKNGGSVDVPVFDFHTNAVTGRRTVSPADVIVFDGLFATSANLLTLADYVVYSESPLYARLLRRMVRSRYDRYNIEFPLMLQNMHLFRVFRAHNELVAPQKSAASAVVCIPYRFEESIERFHIPILYNSARLSNLRELFVFSMNSDEAISVVMDNAGILRFTVQSRRNVYIDIPIPAHVFEELKRLDFDGV